VIVRATLARELGQPVGRLGDLLDRLAVGLGQGVGLVDGEEDLHLEPPLCALGIGVGNGVDNREGL
jgi:hypothetical protein